MDFFPLKLNSVRVGENMILVILGALTSSSDHIRSLGMCNPQYLGDLGP